MTKTKTKMRIKLTSDSGFEVIEAESIAHAMEFVARKVKRGDGKYSRKVTFEIVD